MIHLGTIPLTHQSTIIEARNKLRVVIEALTDDEVQATRLATACSVMARVLQREGTSPTLEVSLEADSSSWLLWIAFADARFVAENSALAFFDHVVTGEREGGGHQRRGAVRLRQAGAADEHLLQRLRAIIQQKGRDELMAEVQAKNVELQESLENLRRTTSAKDRMESELKIGQEIQMSMLPLVFPPFPDRHEFTIFAKLIPAREVGGDFYDFFFVDEEHLCLCVGDVAGKGVPAALFMAVTRTLIKATAKEDGSPASIMTRVNEELSERNESCTFVTVFLGILNVETGVFRYTNAGHNPPYIRHADSSLTRIDERHGLVIGGMSGLEYSEGKRILTRDDCLVLYTDGVTEAMNVKEELYSERRLAELIHRRAISSVEEAVEVVMRDTSDHADGAEQSDDITVLALMYRGLQTQKDSFAISVPNNLSSIDLLNEEFENFCVRNEVPEDVMRRIEVVFDELLSNIISYGFDDGELHEIDVQGTFDCRRLVLEIQDDGRPFNPFVQESPDTTVSLEDRHIGGLGIHLVRQIMDEVSYERRINKNVVRLVRRFDSNDQN